MNKKIIIFWKNEDPIYFALLNMCPLTFLFKHNKYI